MGTRAGNLTLLGGRLCLDFANTVDWRVSDGPREWLNSYADLLAWSHHAGILAETDMRRLAAAARSHPAEAAAVLARATTLREAVYRIFKAALDCRVPDQGDLAIFNAELCGALTRLRIVPVAEGFAWDWQAGEPAFDLMLWPIARSAGELLASEDLNKARECADERCGWLFLDTSRNRTRRWCEMKSCGNRAKARRHYAQTTKVRDRRGQD